MLIKRKPTINLDRFISAQENSYHIALQEVKNGQKKSHWVWFIFPQVEGLGYSPAAQYYAIRSIDEAEAYAGHPVLGTRLREIATAVLNSQADNISKVFCSPDNLKLLSSLTLFWLVTGEELFENIINKYYAGEICEHTKQWINERNQKG